MGDIKKAWRIRFNLTGNVLVASSGDGTVRIFKALFSNQWVQLTDVNTEAYLEESGQHNKTYSKGETCSVSYAQPLL